MLVEKNDENDERPLPGSRLLIGAGAGGTAFSFLWPANLARSLLLNDAGPVVKSFQNSQPFAVYSKNVNESGSLNYRVRLRIATAPFDIMLMVSQDFFG